MGKTLQTDVRLGSHFHSFFIFFFIHFFYCRKMNLAISLGLILAAVMVTARMDKPGDETNNYVDKAAAKPAIPGDEEIVRIVRTIGRHRLWDFIHDTPESRPDVKTNPWDKKAEKKESNSEMADEDKEDEAELGEVDDAKWRK